MYEEVINTLKEKIEKSIEFYKNDIASLRTGRASSSLVEDLKVDYFGQKTPLNQIASISVQAPSTIIIKPWDKNALEPISNAISSSQLGVAPIAESDFVRLNMPALTQERREQLVKFLGQKTEEAKISIRQEREHAIKELSKLDLPEDSLFKAKDQVQKIIDDCNKKVKEIHDAKEKDIMSV